ncbi:uncharacterized protein G2W53_012716 [Senna tora]|uniref:Uncharacterized protein n=1 Tax=Senna tora TaxID=362788 RepID=A0A834TX81_9FABA|nr:uncharacterized protein G2W53_012716 [Senna tora]
MSELSVPPPRDAGKPLPLTLFTSSM